MDLKVRCGTLIINEFGEVLFCIANGSNTWDIPKGLKGENETFLGAACREMVEETGLEYRAEDFVELGEYKFDENSQLLVLYKINVKKEAINLNALVCESTYVNRQGINQKEVDGYAWGYKDSLEKSPEYLREILAKIDWA